MVTCQRPDRRQRSQSERQPWRAWQWEKPSKNDHTPRYTVMERHNMERGWIRLIVGFQPLMVISPTASWIPWCVQVYACELMWTCLVWAIYDLRPRVLGCQATDSIPPQVSRNKSLRPFILTPSRPVGCLTQTSQTSPFSRLWCDAVGDRTPASRTPSGRSLSKLELRWVSSGYKGAILYWQMVPITHNLLELLLASRHHSLPSASFLNHWMSPQNLLGPFILHAKETSFRYIMGIISPVQTISRE